MEDLPSDDGDQNDKQRSCFWWFMEVGEWGGMTDLVADVRWRQLARMGTAYGLELPATGRDRPAEFHALVQVPWPRIASADDDLLIRLFGYIMGDRG